MHPGITYDRHLIQHQTKRRGERGGGRREEEEGSRESRDRKEREKRRRRKGNKKKREREDSQINKHRTKVNKTGSCVCFRIRNSPTLAPQTQVHTSSPPLFSISLLLPLSFHLLLPPPFSYVPSPFSLLPLLPYTQKTWHHHP